MAATETDAAPVVQDDGKSAESKTTEAEQPARTAHSETVENDGAAENKETVDNDTAAAAEEGEGAAASEEAAPPQENASSAEPKPSLLDSFLNKSGLGKVMAGRKKKEPSSAAAGDENAAEGGEREGDKGGKEGEKGAEEGEEAEGETAPENGEEEDKKAEKAKGAEPKSTVRDLIRKPVARIFSHRSTEKKDGAPAEQQKPVKVRSKSLDRLEDPEALNAMADAATAAAEEGGAAGGAEEEQKASAATKHMRRWHSFKKMMAQKTHKKSSGEDKEEGPEGDGGGRDSSTLDSKDSAQQKRWKLKRSWTFQGLKRDSSIVGISGKSKTEETAEGGEEGKEEGGVKEAKADGEEEKEKGEVGEEEKAAGGGTVTQHANEIWTSFKKRVIPKSKRANTECAPGGEEDAAAAASGEEPNADRRVD